MAALLVTELVTNAVLHARTAIVLIVDVGPGRVFLRVRDGSDAIPAPRRYGVEAATGRGLALVEQLATAWGVDPERRWKGSVVPDRLSRHREHEHERERIGVMTVKLTTVTLVNAPVALIFKVNQHQQELMREFELIQLSDDRTKQEVPKRLLEVVDRHRREFSTMSFRRTGTVADANERGASHIDMEIDVPPTAGPAALELLRDVRRGRRVLPPWRPVDARHPGRVRRGPRMVPRRDRAPARRATPDTVARRVTRHAPRTDGV